MFRQVQLSEEADRRLKGLVEETRVSRYPLCIEKGRLVTESWMKTEGDPVILRLAKASEHLAKHFPIFIREKELIVGNAASQYMGMEINCFWGPIYEEEIRKLEDEGFVYVPDGCWEKIREITDYWKDKNLQYKIGQVLGSDRIWAFAQTGILLPPFRAKEEGVGGLIGSGLHVGIQRWIGAIDFEMVLKRGLKSIIDEAEDELEKIRYMNLDSVRKAIFLRAGVIGLNSIIVFAQRFSKMARMLAEQESDRTRKEELREISKICAKVPAYPPSTFKEAIQCFWFVTLFTPWEASSAGRFDQYMYPFYEKDIKEGRITPEEALELLGHLRVKDMELILAPARSIKRQQYAGFAKWHNFNIGGVDQQGHDATNELTYLILEAAKRVRTPHHTITLRVHDGTPEELMIKAIEVVKTGIGMPAFVGDRSYIEYLLSQGVPLELARNYVVAGCIEASIPGHSRQSKCTFFVFPKVLEVFINGGKDERTGIDIGPFSVEIEKFESFEEMYEAFKAYLVHFIKLAAELINIDLACVTEFSSPIDSMLMADAVKEGKAIFERKMTYENGAAMSQCGLVNVADSLAAIKKLVFEEKLVSMKDLKDALRKNWQGYEHIRKMCLMAPKYGNDDDYVDWIVADLYNLWQKTLSSIGTVWGGIFKAAGISITSQWAGGAITGATPDGRYAGEVLADGGASPMRGRDACGPTAVIKSALKIDQARLQSVLLNMKFHPSSLRTVDDMKKLSSLIMTYFRLGGKHIQFNVVDKETLIDAQRNPERHRDLVVRVAGFSAYFVQLSREVQDEIIARTELAV